MKNLIKQLMKDESGQDMAEYAIALGVITVAAIAIFATLGGAITTKLQSVVTVLNG